MCAYNFVLIVWGQLAYGQEVQVSKYLCVYTVIVLLERLDNP